MELKLELVLVPVSDVDRAKFFYTEKVGFELDVVSGHAPGRCGHRGRKCRAGRARGGRQRETRHMGHDGWAPGADPEHRDYASFADFTDPDGNSWVLQEVRVGKLRR